MDDYQNVFAYRRIPERLEQHSIFVKDTGAYLWKLIDSIKSEFEDPEANAEVERLKQLAKNELEEAVMWATKALSRC